MRYLVFIIFFLAFNAYSQENLLSQIVRNEQEIGEISEAEEDHILEENPIVICLGQSCFALFRIKEFGLRQMAYPFDWNIIYHNALIKLIENDFSDLLTENYIHFENHTRIWNTVYGGGVDLQQGFVFCHVCPSQATKDNFFQQYFPYFKEHMLRRIRRFYKALNSKKHVYFVRAQVPLGNPEDVSQNNIGLLAQLIRNKFPNLNFTILAVNCTESSKSNWNMPNVANFYHSGHDDEESSKTWKSIFQSIGLLEKGNNNA